MKNYLIAAAFVALTACGSNEAQVAEDMAQADGIAAATQTASDRAATEMAGTYEVTAEDGAVILQKIDADGTYIETVDGAETERGTWHQKGDQMCFDPEGGTIEQCYTGGKPGSDDSFSVEMDGGTASVRRVDDTETAEPATAGADAQ